MGVVAFYQTAAALRAELTPARTPEREASNLSVAVLSADGEVAWYLWTDDLTSRDDGDTVLVPDAEPRRGSWLKVSGSGITTLTALASVNSDESERIRRLLEEIVVLLRETPTEERRQLFADEMEKKGLVLC